jgi:hypothetical protein
MQKEGRRECNAKRWSARLKRKKSYESEATMQKKITTKSKTNPTPVLWFWGGTVTSCQPKLRENHLPSGENHDSVKKIPWNEERKMNDERKQQTNSEPWRSRIALRLRPPDVLPSGWDNCSSNTTVNWSGTITKGECSTLSSCPPRENSPDPSLPIERTNWLSGSSQGAAQASHTWMRTIATASLFNIVFQTCLQSSSQICRSYFWESVF